MSAYAEVFFQEGDTEWGISGGYGENFHISDISEDVQFYFLTPYWGKVFKHWDGSGSLE